MSSGGGETTTQWSNDGVTINTRAGSRKQQRLESI